MTSSMIRYRNNYDGYWRYSDCAEIVMSYINQHEKHTQIRCDSFSHETISKGLEVLKKYDIEGAEIIDVGLEVYDIEGAEIIDVGLEVKELVCFKPLVHALIRAVRDDQDFKWGILEAVASTVSQRKDQVFAYTPECNGSINWLVKHVDPELWVPALPELETNYDNPLFWSIVAAFSGKMDQIKRYYPNIKEFKLRRGSYQSPYEALRMTSYVGHEGNLLAPFCLQTSYGFLYWLPKEWFEYINYRFK